jgi:hypothetical protein
MCSPKPAGFHAAPGRCNPSIDWLVPKGLRRFYENWLEPRCEFAQSTSADPLGNWVAVFSFVSLFSPFFSDFPLFNRPV